MLRRGKRLQKRGTRWNTAPASTSAPQHGGPQFWRSTRPLSKPIQSRVVWTPCTFLPKPGTPHFQVPASKFACIPQQSMTGRLAASTLTRLGPYRQAPQLCSRGPRRQRGSQVVTCFASPFPTAPGGHERILRYPDGSTRRLYYPAPVPEEEVPAELSGEGWDTVNYWKAPKPRSSNSSSSTAPDQASTAAAPAAPQTEEQAKEQQAERTDQVPDSPLQLLRYLTSDAYKRSQRELWQRVRESYQVLEGCPWVSPRPLFVLATAQAGHEEGLTYTLRTRVGRADQEEELSRVLGGRRRPDGSPVIRCSEIRDGVVAFESEEEAQRYGEQLEAEGLAMEVSVAQCNSHALFRSVQSVQGVVVLLRPVEGFMPQPHELATALRGQRSLEEGSMDEF